MSLLTLIERANGERAQTSTPADNLTVVIRVFEPL